MHKYMKAIGFPELRKKDIQILIEEIVNHPDVMNVAKDSDGNEFAEFKMEVAPGIGIAVRGNFSDEDDEFEAEYYVPYFKGSTLTTDALVDVQKHAEKESYAGICEDPRVGLSIIFYANDVASLLAEYKEQLRKAPIQGAFLSALCNEGTVLLPISDENRVHDYMDEKIIEKLKNEASEGNEAAMTDLGIKEMNLYALISKRVMKEDILSIVSTYLMPYGVESDHYGILGNILDVREVENIITEEHLYVMKLDVNGLIMDVCMAKKDLLGIPAVGRRFKGNIWMLGTIGAESDNR